MARHRAGSRRVACSAVPAVFPVALRVTDEPAATLAVENHHAWRLGLDQLYAGAAQSFFDIDVLAVHQTSLDGVDVVAGPELALPALRLVGEHESGALVLQVGGEIEVLSHHAATCGPHPIDVIAVPVAADLNVDAASRHQRRLVGLLVHQLAIDAVVSAYVDVGLRPWDVGVSVIAGLLLGEQFGLIQVGDVATPILGPEGQPVADVAATVL